MLAKHKEERKAFLAKAKERRDAGKDSENYFPAGGLPDDSVIVVRTDALREFEQSINAATESKEKPMTTTERTTLLTIVAALCDYSAIDTDDTIRKILAKIPDALERRMR